VTTPHWPLQLHSEPPPERPTLSSIFACWEPAGRADAPDPDRPRRLRMIRAVFLYESGAYPLRKILRAEQLRNRKTIWRWRELVRTFPDEEVVGLVRLMDANAAARRLPDPPDPD
jgi:hypothetical protein